MGTFTKAGTMTNISHRLLHLSINLHVGMFILACHKLGWIAQYKVIPMFKLYMVKKEGNKFQHSSSAPPLLIVALLNPEFKEVAQS
ncbi:uncharacterized protein ACA1_067070 [Acanthamoeba castellanii str. Neff]|uniref:Uncharacterized protein n=1 Tax=Acanthamoeba castellanii (strain ATCC 30010 / Neff) TaxID=1257118 RepID=L8GRA9_ACACF|nr:uncharacterized protein ACA1_067070 [Acanthamoeba castellanii str. Neff]ELR14656.1 hypothetical protein ACA1_067070 [Acanthamoeba castellanii str. Neff]